MVRDIKIDDTWESTALLDWMRHCLGTILDGNTALLTCSCNELTS